MGKQHQKEAVLISRAIEDAGIRGVHVDVDELETVYLDGQVADSDEEALAVQAAIKGGAGAVVDGLTYPGQRAVTHHIAAVTSGIPVNHSSK